LSTDSLEGEIGDQSGGGGDSGGGQRETERKKKAIVRTMKGINSLYLCRMRIFLCTSGVQPICEIIIKKNTTKYKKSHASDRPIKYSEVYRNKLSYDTKNYMYLFTKQEARKGGEDHFS